MILDPSILMFYPYFVNHIYGSYMENVYTFFFPMISPYSISTKMFDPSILNVSHVLHV